MSAPDTQGTAISAPASTELPGEGSAAWWTRLSQSVDELARRYPRTYGATIPSTWRDDDETVELLACITCWRSELDKQRQGDVDGEEAPDLIFAAGAVECARQQWEWHAHRDQWLARLAETGNAPLLAVRIESHD